jgi:hypothetical protein
MSEPYDLFSGRSLERPTALSDGLFAVAMTLHVLDMRVPVYFIVSPGGQVARGGRPGAGRFRA